MILGFAIALVNLTNGMTTIVIPLIVLERLGPMPIQALEEAGDDIVAGGDTNQPIPFDY